jgi:hypothetical protein
MTITRFAYMTLFACLVALADAGCDGRTIVGTPDEGPGAGGTVGSGGAMVSGTGGGIVLGIGGAGIGGQGVGGAQGEGGTPGTGGSGVGGNGTGGAPGGNTCPVAGVSATPKTVAGMRTALVRRWVRCSAEGLIHRGDEDGVEITADDRYSMLTRDPTTGQLVARHGVDFEGSVSYLQVGEHIQVDFNSDLLWTIISGPVISTNPTMLIINNNGVVEYRYVTE